MTNEQTIRSITRACRGPLPQKARDAVAFLLKEGRHQEAASMDAASRLGCGYDFNNVIVAGPHDGQLHEYTCPKCKLTGQYRAPWFEVADGH